MRVRLDKYLADMGYGTRSQARRDIAKGNVSVNGSIVKRPEQKVDTDKDAVSVNGEAVRYAEYEYYMLNKPAGVISASKDAHEATVLDLITEKQRQDLFPVGRLDKDTEGLLLITNDGALAHRLLSPRRHVDKVYYARIDKCVTQEDRAKFEAGLDIGDEKPALPAKLEVLSRDPVCEILLTVKEGRFHQVKRMFESVGKHVLYLKRVRMGTLVLDESLKPGEYRKLTKEEIGRLC